MKIRMEITSNKPRTWAHSHQDRSYLIVEYNYMEFTIDKDAVPDLQAALAEGLQMLEKDEKTPSDQEQLHVLKS